MDEIVFTPFTKVDELTSHLEQHLLLTPKIRQAIHLSSIYHRGQKRDDGGDFLEQHIYPIVYSIQQHQPYHPRLSHMILLGFLHDIVEDTDYELEDLLEGFGEEVHYHIDLLTKPPFPNNNNGNQHKKFLHNRDYIQRIMNANIEAVSIVKLEDRINNLASTGNFNGNGKYLRYLRESRELFIPLAESVSPEYISRLEDEIARFASKREG